jgi:hypothetical protein
MVKSSRPRLRLSAGNTVTISSVVVEAVTVSIRSESPKPTPDTRHIGAWSTGGDFGRRWEAST